ncbi:DNA-binding response regulator [Xylanibacillus composti]|uniref:DNA-binding response regulator n=1 Tax=Xylanibacillus composti TaxID=1572762 RepID=A0A8J4H1I5_9BACL|nr:response regulator transcription factor [Xylanibacillus composti]MDT9725823.1 DNA-binding response regulator [Xylanibacillus composti]GIQ69223.1 DNA-binding response regulator [Xylanibacillus composti]
MSTVRLLLVDDQELIRESLHIVLDMDPALEVAGMAENGEEAVRLCEQLQPDLILMDIHMPVMNGVEATQIIKQRWPDTKIIILTTFQEVHYVVDALSAGAEGYLLKAIHPKDLAAGVKWVAEGNTLIPQDIAQILITQLKSGSPVVPATPVPHDAPDAAERSKTYGLSEREMQVLQCISEGLNNREIAERLFLSEGTVKNYISNIYSKLDVRDRIQASRKAHDEGLV